MVRISDILKKKHTGFVHKPSAEEKAPISERPASEQISVNSEKDTDTEKKKKQERRHASASKDTSTPVQISRVMATSDSPQTPASMQMAKAMQDITLDAQKSQALYLNIVKLTKGIWEQIRKKQPARIKEIRPLLSEVVNYLAIGDKTLLSLFFEYSSDNYLWIHPINTAILAIEIGLGLGYNKLKLNQLTLAAFLYDFGMVTVESISQQTRVLAVEEYRKIKEHPLASVEILKQVEDLDEVMIVVARQHHERLNGEGYPCRLKDKDLHEYSKIVALADVYEALTHQRPYRKAYQPHEAIKEIISTDKNLFDSNLIKVLINRLGFYPVGSWVELNTGEIGKVISSTEDMPLRPVVNIIFTGGGEKIEEKKIVNLGRQYNLYIKNSIPDEELKKRIHMAQ
jgi:HD-GYP domain-containing protein (c-di-GMP phosphodiesterase class II)